VTVVSRAGRGAFVHRTISGDSPAELASAEQVGQGRCWFPSTPTMPSCSGSSKACSWTTSPGTAPALTLGECHAYDNGVVSLSYHPPER